MSHPHTFEPDAPQAAHFPSVVSDRLVNTKAWAEIFVCVAAKMAAQRAQPLTPLENLVRTEQDAHLGAELLAASRPNMIMNREHIISGVLAAKELPELYVKHDIANNIDTAREMVLKMLNTSMDKVQQRAFPWPITPSMLGWAEHTYDTTKGTLITCLQKDPAQLPPLPPTAHMHNVGADVRQLEQQIMDTHGLRTGDACQEREYRRLVANQLVDAYMQHNLFTDPATQPPRTTTLDTARAAALPFIEACGQTVSNDHEGHVMPPLNMQTLFWPDNPAERSAKANELLEAGRQKPWERGGQNSHGMGRAAGRPQGPPKPARQEDIY